MTATSAPARPSPRTDGLSIGGHVRYFDVKRAEPRDALIQVIFERRPQPDLTLIVVRSGERGITNKVMVPHISAWKDEPGYWYRESERA